MLSRRSFVGVLASAAMGRLVMPEVGAAQRAVRAERRRTGSGLAKPNPGLKRAIGLPRTMASPPTVGAPSPSSGIANGHRVTPDDPVFRYLGCEPGQAGLVSDTGYWTFNSATGPDSITSPAGNMAWSVEFMHYGAVLEWVTKGRGDPYTHRFRVDGEFVDETPLTNIPLDGGEHFVSLTFATAAHRRIRVEMGGAFFGGIHVGPTDDVYAVSDPEPVRAIVLTDSYGEGTAELPGSGGLLGFVPKLGDLMGWDDIWASGSGGTGYLNPGGSGRVTYRDRVQNDVIQWEPYAVIVAGGANEYAYAPGGVLVTPAQIEAEAALLFAGIRAGLPAAKLIVAGPWWWQGAVTERVLDVRDAIRDAAQDHAHLWVETIGGPYPHGTPDDHANTGLFTGVGHVGAEVDFGNANLFITTDGVHPTAAGYAKIAHEFAAQIGAWVDAGMPDSP